MPGERRDLRVVEEVADGQAEAVQDRFVGAAREAFDDGAVAVVVVDDAQGGVVAAAVGFVDGAEVGGPGGAAAAGAGDAVEGAGNGVERAVRIHGAVLSIPVYPDRRGLETG